MPAADSSSQSVIVLNSFGQYLVYPATISCAKSLLEDKLADIQAYPSYSYMQLRLAAKNAASPSPYLVPVSLVQRAFKDLTSLELGAESTALYRLLTPEPEKGKSVATCKEWRDAFVLWAFDKNFKLEDSDASSLNRVRPEQALPFFAGLLARADGAPLEYASDDALDEAKELEQLLHGRWKDDANVDRVVVRYLDMVNRYSHRDEKYELGVFRSKV